MRKILTLFLLLPGLVSAGYDRVVSLSPAITETIFALGRGDRLIARSSACDRPEEVKNLPTAGNFAQINVEKLLALNPDCVISDTVIDLSKAEPLTRAGIRFEVLSCATLPEYAAALKRLGELLDASEAAGREIAAVEAAMAEPRAADGPRVLWILWRSPVIAAGRGTLPDEALAIAGYRNAATEKGYFKPAPERLVAMECDILIADGESGDPSGDPVLRFLKPVREGRVLLLPPNSRVERPGPGFLAGAAELKELLAGIPREEP